MRTKNATANENYLIMAPEKKEPGDLDVNIRLTNDGDRVELTVSVGKYNAYSIRESLNKTDVALLIDWLTGWYNESHTEKQPPATAPNAPHEAYLPAQDTPPAQ